MINKEGWEKKRFDQVFDLQMGKTPSRDKKDYWKDGKNKWVSIADLKNQKYISESKELISDIAVKESGIKKVPENTVIMSFKLSIGKTAITKETIYTNEAIMAFHIKQGYDIDVDFLYYYLNTYKWIGSNKAVMGNTLNKATISLQKIELPPLPIQQQIVSELDTLSDIISKKKQQLSDLDTLAQATFYDMFGNPVSNEKGWKAKPLNKITKVGTGGTPSRKREQEFYNGSINWAKTTEVKGKYIFDTEEKITELALVESNCKVYPIGTILLAMYGQGKTRGNVGFLKIEAATNQACATISPNEELIQVFLYELLKNSYEYLRGLARGGNQENLNLNIVGNIKIIIPPISLQTEFVEKIESIEEQKELINKSIEDVQHLFDYTMDKYFN